MMNVIRNIYTVSSMEEGQFSGGNFPRVGEGASSVKIIDIYSSCSPEMNIWTCRGQITLSQVDEIRP